MNSPRRLLLTFALLLPFVAAVPAAQAQQSATRLDPQAAAALDRVEAWIRSLDTVSAEFIQRSDGGAASGRFLWSRPRAGIEGGVRFDYQDPHKHFLTTSGDLVYFWDAVLETQSQDDIEDTPVDILMRPDLSLRDDDELLLTGAELRQTFSDTQVLAVQLRNAEDPQAGLLTLVFELNPVRLARWNVQLPDGQFTAVDLYNISTGVPIDEDVFVFRRPDLRFDTTGSGTRGGDR